MNKASKLYSFSIVLIALAAAIHSVWLAMILSNSRDGGDVIKMNATNVYADTIRISTGAVGICIGWLVSSWSNKLPDSKKRWLVLALVSFVLIFYILIERLVTQLVRS